VPPKAGFNLLERGDPHAFQVAAPGLGEERFSHKTILNPQRFFHRVPKVLLNLTCCCHTQKTNPKGMAGQHPGTPAQRFSGCLALTRPHQKTLRWDNLQATKAAQPFSEHLTAKILQTATPLPSQRHVTRDKKNGLLAVVGY
jgi:hypothetical protein